MKHGLLLLLGLMVKDFIITLEYQIHHLNDMGFGLGITFAQKKNVEQQK
jgi:hypothetical protein